MQRYEEALIYIERALAADNDPSDELYEHAGDIFHQLGNKSKALEYWRKAFALKRNAGTMDKNLDKKIKGTK
jgi:tetratricopeptide (TPR) repeat protein